MLTKNDVQKIIQKCKTVSQIEEALNKAGIIHEVGSKEDYNYYNAFIPYRDCKIGFVRIYERRKNEIIIQEWFNINDVLLPDFFIKSGIE